MDDYGTVEYTWNVSYFVYHPPEPEEPDEQSTVSRIVDTLSDNFMTVLIGVLSTLVILLLVIRLRQNKPTNIPVNPPPPQAFGQATPQNRYEPKQSKYGDVKSAPDLSMLDNKWK